MKSILKFLISNFTLQSNSLRYAIRLTIACSLAVILYELFQLKNGYWAAFSVIACLQPTLGRSLQRSKQRILGTFIGMWIAILIAHSFGNNRIIIDILLPIFIFLTYYLKIYSYGLFSVFTTVVTVLFVCLITPSDWSVAISRLFLTAGGTVIAVIANIFVFPSRVSRTLPEQLASVRLDIKKYYDLICQNYLRLETTVLHSTQSQVARDLQTALATIEESRQEYWRSSPKYFSQSKIYFSCEKIYQRLLTLEIYLPRIIKEHQLQIRAEELRPILAAISMLLDDKNRDCVAVLRSQLTHLLLEIQDQRRTAAENLLIPTATFYEYIQLTLFIENLTALLNHIHLLNQSLYTNRGNFSEPFS